MRQILKTFLYTLFKPSGIRRKVLSMKNDVILCRPLNNGTHLLPGEAEIRRNRDRDYLMSMSADNLLRAHRLEAGLIRMCEKPEGIFWGWESPLSDLRGTLAGHWLSAAAHMSRDLGDPEMAARAQVVVDGIARCQRENGGRWAFGIPEKYMARLRDGGHPWAPQYVCHKDMMGLMDMYTLCGNRQALDVLLGCADWFYDFTSGLTPEQMEDMRDREETGGIMELWADLYAVTGDKKHLALMRRYERHRLADLLLRGEDPLTNMHANSTIPEILGYARAYEVTGEPEYRRVVEAYWDLAVDKRGAYATGGQTDGEVWTPMGRLSARLGDKTQEHCVVYHMMRLADYLFRWTGDARFMDYNEKARYNGIYAQGFCPRGGDYTTVAYYLPLKQGGVKKWGSRYEDFWCCHMTLLQANAIHHEGIFHLDTEGVLVSQYIPSETRFSFGGTEISLSQDFCSQTGGEMMKDSPVNREILSRPHCWKIRLALRAEKPCRFRLKLRAPAWRSGEITVTVNGVPAEAPVGPKGFIGLDRVWSDDIVEITVPKELRCESLPDDPDMAAFLDGPVCLAGLVPEEHILYGDRDHPENSLLCASDEREWQSWTEGWKAYHQPFGIEFRPLYRITDERYTVYFPIRPAP